VLPELLADLSPDREPTGRVAGELLAATFANAVVLKKYQLADIVLGHIGQAPPALLSHASPFGFKLHRCRGRYF
jgi:hypothetical protein